jgi:hypothetical protein
MTPFEQGFMDKCAELGVDPAALVKAAAVRFNPALKLLNRIRRSATEFDGAYRTLTAPTAVSGFPINVDKAGVRDLLRMAKARILARQATGARAGRLTRAANDLANKPSLRVQYPGHVNNVENGVINSPYLTMRDRLENMVGAWGDL